MPGQTLRELGDMGWQEFGVLELTALPSVLEEHWLPAVEAADIIIVGGGNTGYLSYWMHESGFAEKLPELLRKKVYMGVSAGSMVVTHSLNVNREELQKTGIYYDDDKPLASLVLCDSATLAGFWARAGENGRGNASTTG